MYSKDEETTCTANMRRQHVQQTCGDNVYNKHEETMCTANIISKHCLVPDDKIYCVRLSPMRHLGSWHFTKRNAIPST